MGTARDRAVAVARRLQGLRRLVPRPVPPAPAPVALPADVADAEGLRRRLAETDIFGAAAEEAHGYLFDAFERFRITMALLPALGSGARVLELGANPYFLTRLLRDRGYDMTLANWFGPSSGFGSRGSQTVTESGVPYTYEFDHFNIEADPFPYDDDAFDAVLFCEILEHLPFDPIHTLAEIHRVLRPGGALVLTTPNAIRLDNLIRMAEGRNVYETLSGYGTYGRHNREYTVDELRLLLDGCGFAVQSVFAADIGHPPPPASFGPEVSGVDRGENLFAVARAEGPPRWQYPPWLYSSVHALKKAVRSDVVCGVNCDLQTGGLYDVERSVLVSGGHVRWTGRAPRASLLLRCAGGPARLRLTGVAPPLGSVAAGSLTLHAELDGQVVSWALACDGRAFAVDAEVKAAEGDQEVALWTDRTWSPAAGGTSPDTRVLGVMLATAALDPLS